jgi:ectoine hydroxylase-related dioxygenase (phytanoyl-CoA dioxygenase family)
VEPEISTIWALQDFTHENGATRVVLGSHRWPKGREPRENIERASAAKENNGVVKAEQQEEWREAEKEEEEEEVVQAIMPKGSVVAYLGSTWHSGGANVSGAERWGCNVDYNLSLLRQEENQVGGPTPSVASVVPGGWAPSVASARQCTLDPYIA